MPARVQPRASAETKAARSDGSLALCDRFRPPLTIFWAAFAVRLIYMTLAHTYRIRPYEDHFQFGWEMGRIARALVTGYGYADPFGHFGILHTGPTAWLPPLYPLLMAAVFNLFGVYTLQSAWVLLALNSLFSAATVLAIYEIAARCYSRSVALWSAWLWALYPAAMQYAVRWVWEMSLTTMLFAFVLVLSLRMRGIGEALPPEQGHAPGQGTLGQWGVFGLLWGLIALSNSTLLLFLPVCGIWILLGAARKSDALRGAVLSAAVCLLCLAPWVARNWLVFHAFVPMRANFGAELYMGDGPGSTGLLMEYDHPFQARDQLLLYARMGELLYARLRGQLAMENIRAHKAHFVAISLKRFLFFWFSVPHPPDHPFSEYGRIVNFSFTSVAGLLGLALSLKRRKPAAALFAWAFVLLPLTYYLVTVHARFRHPLEPLICIFAVYLFQSAELRMPRWLSPARSR